MEKVIVQFDLNQNSFKPEEESMESLFDYYDAEYSKGFCPQGLVEDNMLQFPKTCLSNQNESVIDNIKIEDINNNLEIDEKIYFINSPKENLDTKNNTPDLLNKKTKRKNEKNETKKDEKTTSTNNKKQKCGRKSTKETNNGEVHDKYKGDNIIRKIKVHIIQDKIIKLINNYIKAKKLSRKKLLKLYQDDINCLKKDKNLIFMNTTLKDIYKYTKIANKYYSDKAKNNEKLIDEIYSKNEFIELRKILNLTFLEFFEIYTHDVTEKTLSEELLKKKEDIEILNSSNFTGINNYINKLAKKEEKNETSEDLNDNYTQKVKEFCRNYKKWFEDKKGRNEELNY